MDHVTKEITFALWSKLQKPNTEVQFHSITLRARKIRGRKKMCNGTRAEILGFVSCQQTNVENLSFTFVLGHIQLSQIHINNLVSTHFCF
jgi:hypothetical protein